MKRWIGAFVATILACIPILVYRATSSDLLKDTDTKVLLEAIRARNAPFSWFGGDWPLANHFYRPVSTLAFEMDNRLYGSNAAGYGLSNALLCVACVLLLFWFLRELTDRPFLTAGAAILFALQHLGIQGFLLSPIYYLAIVTAIVGAVRHRQKIRLWIPASLVLFYCLFEVTGLDATGTGSIGNGTIGWLPGRTATVMTVFALLAMAAYARYERLGAERTVPPASPLDPPATKNTKVKANARTANVLWAILSLLGVALALGSYEQAVMLPACMLAIAVTMRANRFKVRWGWQAGFWLLLAGYLVLRKLVIPPGASGYQLQQFRNGPGVRLALFYYSMPFINEIQGFLMNLELGAVALLTTTPYSFLFSAAANLTALYQARRHWTFALAGYGMSIIAFLPMAWVKPFPHYNYWPMALRSLFVVTLLWVAFDLVVIAWSPPTRQAPPRLDPAPGSLPHR